MDLLNITFKLDIFCLLQKIQMVNMYCYIPTTRSGESWWVGVLLGLIPAWVWFALILQTQLCLEDVNHLE